MGCLVTGGAGFIGSHMAYRLVAMGHQAVAIDNESTGSRHNLDPKVLYFPGDVCNPDDLDKAFGEKVDTVFHIAGQASTFKSFTNPHDDLRVNVGAQSMSSRRVSGTIVPRLLYASSMTVYGHPSLIPTPETESCKPISYSGVTKYAAERYVLATAERPDLGFDFRVTCFRMFNVYGERQSLTNPYQGVVAIFIGNLLRGEPITIHSDGRQSRDFIYIGDVVDTWMVALDNPRSYGHVFNLGTGSSKTILQLADVILAAFGRLQADYPVNFTPVRSGD